MKSSKTDFFKPGRTSSQAKAEFTNAAFRQIQDVETAARQKKTEKLRALRLAQPVDEAPVSNKKKKAD